MRPLAFLSIVVALSAVACSDPSRPTQVGTGGSGDTNGGTAGSGGNTLPDAGQGDTGNVAPAPKTRVFTGPPFGFGYADRDDLRVSNDPPCEETCGPHGKCVTNEQNSRICQCDNGLITRPCLAGCRTVAPPFDIDLTSVLFEVKLQVSVAGVPVRDGVVAVYLEFGSSRIEIFNGFLNAVPKGKYRVFYNGKIPGGRKSGDDAPTHTRMFLGDVDVTESTTLTYDFPKPVKLTGYVTLANELRDSRPILTAVDPNDQLVEFNDGLDNARVKPFAYALPGKYLLGYAGSGSVIHFRELVIEPGAPEQDVSFTVPEVEITVTQTFGGKMPTNGTISASGPLGSIKLNPDGPGRFRGVGVPGPYHIEFVNKDKGNTRWPQFDSSKSALVDLKAGDNTFDQPLVAYTGMVLANGPVETLYFTLRGKMDSQYQAWSYFFTPASDGSFSIQAPAVKMILVEKGYNRAPFAANSNAIASINVEAKTAIEIDYRGVSVSATVSLNGTVPPLGTVSTLRLLGRNDSFINLARNPDVAGPRFDGLVMPGAYWLEYNSLAPWLNMSVPFDVPQTGVTQTVDFRTVKLSGHVSGLPSYAKPRLVFNGVRMEALSDMDADRNFSAEFPVGNYYLSGYSAAGCFKIE